MKGETKSPKRPPNRHIAWSWLGGLLGISAVAFLTEYTRQPFLMAPFGASCVLMFGIPDSPLAQPRNVLGGYLVSTIIGLVCYHVLGTEWYSLAIAVSSSIVAMQLTKTVHPPAGAAPLVVIISHANWGFLISPTLTGSLILVLIALLFNNLNKAQTFPKYWR
ncbi:HPP family protein [Pseudarcicella hirudinis]|uniref:HPP family protein n=2 Tax=Pseudarcicella hirudinis TaxID=1079859 RepID=A0A1I5PKS3_9BACT|nr:HPP family protein [Pseudarcicella hirudinis]SFP34400.1 HPP family protein [Pseudarcicella hirudinis]